MERVRYALYFTPPSGSALADFGARVLGYDVDAGSRIPRSGWVDGLSSSLEAVTAAPRRYGFHATLKPPFELAADKTVNELTAQLRSFARSQPPVRLGPLTVKTIGSFVALVPHRIDPALPDLAAACVMTFDGFRAPPSESEMLRRKQARLTPRQLELLEERGYPYVLDEFRFHMTLTGPLEPAALALWCERLSDAYAALAGEDTTLDAITLLRQEGEESFRVLERFALTGSPTSSMRPMKEHDANRMPWD